MPAESRAPLPEGPFEGREAFRQAIRDALAQAAFEGWPDLVLCDPDFEDWPLGERDVAQSLHDGARQGQRLQVLAARYDGVLQRHDRFVNFRRQWGHRIECRVARVDAIGSLFWSPGWMLQRLDAVRSAGLASTDAGRCLRARERFEEHWQQARSGFPVTILGL